MRMKSIHLLAAVTVFLVPVVTWGQDSSSTGFPSAAPWPPPTAPSPGAGPAPATPAQAPGYWNLGAGVPPASAAPFGAPVPAPLPAAQAAETPSLSTAPAAGDELDSLQTGKAAPAAVVSETDERLRGFIPQLSLGGSVGLLHMAAADVGGVLQMRMTLHGEYFTASNFLVQSETGSDRNTRLQGALTFGLTPIEHLEIFGAVLGSSNRNRRMCSTDTNCASEANRTDPELIKSFGDLVIGAKVAYPLAPGFSAAGELGLRFMSSISGISFSPDSTSVWLNAIGTYDFRQTAEVPLRFHLSLGYYVDNSKNLVDYSANRTSAISRYVSMFAYGLSQNRLRVAVGADAPLSEVAEGFSLRPIVEYHLEYLSGTADSEIYKQEHVFGRCGQPGSDPCKDNQDLHYVTLGVQAQVLHGLTLTAGVDLALRSPGFAYAPALPPWNLLFGLGYPIDLVPRIVRNVPVEKIVMKEAPMREGLVAGRVVSAAGAPIEGAVVGVNGREHSRVVTEADGSFQSVPLAPGPIELLVTANGFETATVKTEVIAGQTANIVLRLVPKAPPARATGRVSDDSGKGLVATIKLAGPQIAEVRSDASGNFVTPAMPGNYAVRLDADGYLSKEVQLQVAEGRENALNVTLRSRPAVAGVTFQDGKIKLRQPIAFKAGGKAPNTEFSAGMPLLLDEVVDLLANHSEIRKIRVEAHWDNSLAEPKSSALTEGQAKAVAKYLTDQGVAPERVVAVGMGGKKPLMPNLGKGKVKNRRVELVVAE